MHGMQEHFFSVQVSQSELEHMEQNLFYSNSDRAPKAWFGHEALHAINIAIDFETVEGLFFEGAHLFVYLLRVGTKT